MQTLERAKAAAELWNAVVPFCPAPQMRQFILWTSRFTEPQIERAFFRASRKFAPVKGPCPDPEIVHRYATGIMLNEAKQSATAGAA